MRQLMRGGFCQYGAMEAITALDLFQYPWENLHSLGGRIISLTDSLPFRTITNLLSSNAYSY